MVVILLLFWVKYSTNIHDNITGIQNCLLSRPLKITLTITDLELAITRESKLKNVCKKL